MVFSKSGWSSWPHFFTDTFQNKISSEKKLSVSMQLNKSAAFPSDMQQELNIRQQSDEMALSKKPCSVHKYELQFYMVICQDWDSKSNYLTSANSQKLFPTAVKLKSQFLGIFFFDPIYKHNYLAFLVISPQFCIFSYGSTIINYIKLFYISSSISDINIKTKCPL